jgi:hypothetical protein
MRLASLLLLASCAVSDPAALPLDEMGASTSAPGIDLTVRNLPTASFFAGDLESLTFRARTSVPLTSASAWVPDDAFGITTMPSSRRFDVTLAAGYEVNTALSGLPFLIDLGTANGAYTARVEVAPSFRNRIQTGDIALQPTITPVYVRDAVNPLRYRATVTTNTVFDSLLVTAGNGSVPEVSRPDDTTWNLDWTYESLMAAAIPGPQGGPLVLDGFDAAGVPVASASGRIIVSVADLDMTDGDPYAAWPDEVCETVVYHCLADTWGTDLGACGDYRPVQRCLSADACDYEPTSAIDADEVAVPAIDAAMNAWDAACNLGGQWCGIQSWATYQTPRCLTAGTDFETIVTEVISTWQAQTYHAFQWGTVLDAAGLANHYLFTDTYSDGGPELLEAIYTNVGSRNVQGFVSVNEIPCPNCSEFEDLVILYFPDVGRVVLVNAISGYDS